MTIPTEPIGSIPRPLGLVEAIAHRAQTNPTLESLITDSERRSIEPRIQTPEKVRDRALEALAANVLGVR